MRTTPSGLAAYAAKKRNISLPINRDGNETILGRSNDNNTNGRKEALARRIKKSEKSV